MFGLNFIPMALNTLISSYLYSAKRTREAVILNVCRGLVFSPLIITALPALLGNGVIWFIPTIAEAVTMILALHLLKRSERHGVIFI